MALRDRPVVRRLLEAAEGQLGVTLAPADEVRRLRVAESEFEEFRAEAEDLAFHAMDYFGGRPQELRPERRRRLAQRSRIALMEDPLAGAEAQLLGDFAFGKGIAKPSARNPKVQDVIDEGWTDPVNEQVLFAYQAQRKLSNELITAGELFPTMYEKAGRVRFGRLDPDLVTQIVPDPENRLVPLWYVARERRYEWNFETDMPAFSDQATGDALKVKYWDHWRNVEDAVKDRESEDTTAEQPLVEPSEEKRATGKVYHLAINQTGEQMRGNPPWARSLRFMSAMNLLTESHVTMAQAASTFVARRAMKGNERSVTKAASSVIAAASELGAHGRYHNVEQTQPFAQPGAPGPFPPGSWWNENESSKLEALNLSSGAGQMQQTAQIVRAPVAASSGFGQHYLGDATNANLATASTLELPATMHVGAWQEGFEGLYRWATDRIIEAAVRAGRLGGAQGFPDGKRLQEMRIGEAQDRVEMEKRTGKDLAYEFSMPFPGRRQLADVTTMVQTVSQSQDPNGVNIPLRRILLRFLFEQIGIDDVSHAVDECVPEGGMKGGIGPPEDPAAGAGQFGPPQPAGVGAPGGTGAARGAAANDPRAGQQPYGAKSGTAAGGGSAGPDGSLEGLSEDNFTPEEQAAIEELEAATERLFKRLVADPIEASVAGMGSNGSGG